MVRFTGYTTATAFAARLPDICTAGDLLRITPLLGDALFPSVIRAIKFFSSLSLFCCKPRSRSLHLQRSRLDLCLSRRDLSRSLFSSFRDTHISRRSCGVSSFEKRARCGGSVIRCILLYLPLR